MRPASSRKATKAPWGRPLENVPSMPSTSSSLDFGRDHRSTGHRRRSPARDRPPHRTNLSGRRRVPRGPLPAQERPARRRLRREVPGASGPCRDQRAVRPVGRPRAESRRRANGRRRGRPDDRRDHPRLRNGPPARRSVDLRRGGSRRRRRHPPRIPARVPHRPGGAGAARRRHPHDRWLAPGDDPGRRGRRWRDHRVRRARRPKRRASRAGVATDRPFVCPPLAVAAGPAHLRGWSCNLPALRRRDAAPRARQHGYRRDLRADGPHKPWTAGRSGSSSSRSP